MKKGSVYAKPSSSGGAFRRDGEMNRVWWLHPQISILFLALPILIFSYFVPEGTYITLFQTDKYIDSGFFIASLILYMSFLVGTLFKVSAGKGDQGADLISYCRFFVWPLFGLTLFGYLVWFSYSVVNAGGLGQIATIVQDLLFGADAGYSDYVKEEFFKTIPGVTTIAQLGILYVTVEAILWVKDGSQRRMAILRFSAIAALTMTRVILNSERLSLIELAIPIAVVAAGGLYAGGVRKKLLQIAPILAGLAVMILFAVGEYFRSWNYFKGVFEGSYLEFATQRFMGYYTVSTNNAAVFYYFQPFEPLRHTMNSLFQFPVIGAAVEDWYFDFMLERTITHEYPYAYLLEIYANPALNNISFVGLLPVDFTLALAPFAAFGMGLIASSLYASFMSGRMIGMLLYPSWFIGLLEIPRLYYWSDQRYFPVLGFLLFSLILFKVAKVPTEKPASSKPPTRPRDAEHVRTERAPVGHG